jgi:hypothetical protein
MSKLVIGLMPNNVYAACMAIGDSKTTNRLQTGGANTPDASINNGRLMVLSEEYDVGS